MSTSNSRALLIGAAAASSGGAAAGYEIERSLRFNGNADSAYLNRTPASAGNRTTWTWAGWVKRSQVVSPPGYQSLFTSTTAGYESLLYFDTSHRLRFYNYGGGSANKLTTAVFRDPSAWYHIVVTWDTTNATAADRLRFYVNGIRLTTFDASTDPALSEESTINDTFAQLIGSYGVYANNFFDGYLADVFFVDGQALDPTSFGEFDATTGVWNPIEYTFGTNPNNGTTWSSYGDANADPSFPWTNAFNGNVATTNYVSGTSTTSTWTPPTAITVNSSLRILTATGTTSGLYVNGSLVSSSGSYGNAAWTTITGVSSLSSVGTYNSGTQWTIIYAIEVDGYVLLDGAVDNSFHLPFSNNSSTIDLGTDTSVTVSDAVANKGMDVVTYTGNGSTQTINSLRFAPDFIWIKCRSNGTNHVLQDTVRGITNKLASNGTYAENDGTQLGAGDGYVSAVTSNGFTVTNGSQTNQSSQTYVGWCWKAGGTPVTNTNGSINSQVSANQDYGFSIVTWTSVVNTAHTFGHGLSTAPSMVILKSRTNGSASWQVGHTSIGWTKKLVLNTSAEASAADGGYWNNTAPTDTVVSIGDANGIGTDNVAYCWSEVAGFSKFGSYTGNGSFNGPTITTGFKPRFVMFKNIDTSVDWKIFDAARDPVYESGINMSVLYPNLSNGEDLNYGIKWLDNGFEVVDNSAAINATGNTIIYAAFASEPGNNWAVNNFAVSSTFNGVALDGVDDYLQLTSSEIAVGSGDFTIEAYVNVGSRPADNHNIFSYRGPGGSATGFNLAVIETNRTLALYSDGTILSGGNVPVNQWTHVAISRSSNTLKGFVNGVQFASVTNSTDFSNSTLAIGSAIGGAQSDLQGFISNFRMVKGTGLYTSNFAPPTAPLTNVTNTKLLCCQSSTSTTEAAVTPVALSANGDIYAGTFTDNFAGNDSLRDSPTDGDTANDTGVGGEVPGNYATLNPLDTKLIHSNGNLDATASTSQTWVSGRGTFGVTSGKWYWEVTVNSLSTTSDNAAQVGIHALTSSLPANDAAPDADAYVYVNYQGYKYNNSTGSSYGATWTTGDVIGVAYDADNGTLTFYKNGSSQGTAFTGLSASKNFAPVISLGRSSTSTSVSANFGQRAFAYAAPSGFKALCTANLDDPTIADGSTAHNTVLYTGNGSDDHAITGFGFSPGLLWVKARSAAYDHMIHDVVRGRLKNLRSNKTNAEATDTTNITSFDADGFTTSSGSGYMNGNNVTFAAWAWKAGGDSNTFNVDGTGYSTASAAGITEGTISLTGASVNRSAGFSIVTYTSNTSSNQTVGHGLNAAPHLIIVKNRDDAGDPWAVYTKVTGKDKYLYLNTTAVAEPLSEYWGSAEPTSTVFGVGSGLSNNRGTDAMVAYCFAPIEGYSAFGIYSNNNNANGPFVYTGFRPRYVLIKTTSTSSWVITDSRRSPFNVADNMLFAESSNSEGSDAIDFLSNGFKLRSASGDLNYTGRDYIYAAFAENPFKYARAR